jgi:iron complex outermembrane receptor protein
MRKIYLITFFLFVCQILFAQKATIKGTITDSKTKETFVGVNVIFSDSQGSTTDVFGNYLIELPAGKYLIKYRYIGYGIATREINLKAGETRVINISLMEETKLLDEVVVSAGRHEQKLSEVTVSVELIKAKMLESTNTTSIESAVKQVPGVTIYDDQASIRGGSGYSFGAGSRVLLLLDDLPLLTGSTGEAKWWIIPVENIDQIEVIKGASSALYGSSAMNGVMNVRSGWPTNKPETKVIAHSGVYMNPERDGLHWWGYKQPTFSGYQVMHSHKFGNFDVVGSVNFLSDNGFRETEYNQRVGANFKTRYRSKKIEGESYGVNGYTTRRWAASYLIWKDKDSVYSPASNPMGKINTYAVIDPFIVYYNKNNRHALKTRIYYSDNITDSEQNSTDMMYYGEYQYQHVFKGELVMNTGLAGTYSRSDAQIFGNIAHFSSSSALFAQLDKRWRKWSLSGGARFEGYRDGNQPMEWKPVFRAGLNYQLAKQTYIRSSIGQGYRYPTIAERYTFTSSEGISIFPNPTLKSERGWSGEIAIKQGFSVSNWRAYIDIAGFISEYADMIEFQFGAFLPSLSVLNVTGLPGDIQARSLKDTISKYTGFKATNIPRVRIYGIDATLAGKGSIGNVPVAFLAGLTVIEPLDLDTISLATKTTTDPILKYRFRTTAKVDVEVTYRKLTAGVSFDYFSNMVNIDKIFEDEVLINNMQPSPGKPIYIFPGLKEYRATHNKGEYSFDARMSWQMNANSKFSIIMKNILNREYMVRPGSVQAPRNITFQYAFRM